MISLIFYFFPSNISLRIFMFADYCSLYYDRPHYNVLLEDVKVGDDVLDLPTGLFDFGSNRGTIIDSGTTLAYLTDDLYNQVIKKVCVRFIHLNCRHNTLLGAFRIRSPSLEIFRMRSRCNLYLLAVTNNCRFCN